MWYIAIGEKSRAMLCQTMIYYSAIERLELDLYCMGNKISGK